MDLPETVSCTRSLRFRRGSATSVNARELLTAAHCARHCGSCTESRSVSDADIRRYEMFEKASYFARVPSMHMPGLRETDMVSGMPRKYTSRCSPGRPTFGRPQLGPTAKRGRRPTPPRVATL